MDKNSGMRSKLGENGKNFLYHGKKRIGERQNLKVSFGKDRFEASSPDFIHNEAYSMWRSKWK